jgi:hypothetical protein
MSTETLASEISHGRAKPSSWLSRNSLLVYGILAYGITWGLLFGATAAIQNGSLPSDSPAGFVIEQISASGPALAALVVPLRAGKVWRVARKSSGVGVQWYLFVLIGIPLIVLSGYSVVYGVTIFQSLLQQWPII